jgi:pimeloyl-ACP methyl ester carboxylesterase
VRVDEYTTDLNGSPVFYRSAPADGTPTLYLHGIPTSSEDWIPFLEQTGGLAPDLLGFGRSGKAGHLDYSIDGEVEFVKSVLEGLQLDRISLVGHGWGAAIGLALAQHEPDRIAKLVLINPLPVIPDFKWPGIARAWRRPGLGELVMGSIPRWLFTRTMRRGGPWTEAQLATIWEQFDQGTQRAILRLHRDAAVQRLAIDGIDVGGLDSPALVLWGEDDPWFPVGLAEAYAASLPRASLERIPHAGHWPWLDQPSVVDRVAAFLHSPP